MQIGRLSGAAVAAMEAAASAVRESGWSAAAAVDADDVDDGIAPLLGILAGGGLPASTMETVEEDRVAGDGEDAGGAMTTEDADNDIEGDTLRFLSGSGSSHSGGICRTPFNHGCRGMSAAANRSLGSSTSRRSMRSFAEGEIVAQIGAL